MENFYLKKNLLLKLEMEKDEYIEYFTSRLMNLDISNNLYDIVILLVQSAEEKFYKKNKKLGKVKKDAVLGVLRKVVKTNYDEKMLCGMIESILSNQNIQRLPYFTKVWIQIKAFFQKKN
jgi:hypothetical protein